MSYTSRDYDSIYRDLTNLIPQLTELYKPTEETDPGIVLIKLMSILGDMLSHTADLNVLECFPQTVLQRANAQQIFKLVGYKMQWWKSARCAAYFTNTNSVPVTIGRFNVFTSRSGGITYTNLNQLEIPAGALGSTQLQTELVEGTPVTPAIVTDNIANYTGTWYDAYRYNIDAKTDITNNRIYLSDSNIDGSTIILIDDDATSFANNEWKQVDNLNTVTEVGKIFEFNFNYTNTPYIEFPKYWSTRFSITRFKLFYVKSSGAAGEITDNALVSIGTSKVKVQGSSNVSGYLENVHIYNSASNYGNSPETCAEARRKAELYQNTINTLVVLDDFTKAAKRMQGVANALATDAYTDPNGVNMLARDIKIYMIRKPGYEYAYDSTSYGSTDYDYNNSDSLHDQLWKESVVEELQTYKLAKYNIDVVFESAINWIDWTIEGSLYLRQPVPADKSHDILVSIDQNLDFTFSPSTLDFNEAINYLDVIDNIKSADKLIYHVDLESAAIVYSKIRRNHDGAATGRTIQRRWLIYDVSTNAYTYYYATGYGCAPTPSGDGSGPNAPFRILREGGATWATGLELLSPYGVNEFEIYNNRIYNWVQSQRIDTGYYIDENMDDNPPKKDCPCDDEKCTCVTSFDQLSGKPVIRKSYWADHSGMNTWEAVKEDDWDNSENVTWEQDQQRVIETKDDGKPVYYLVEHLGIMLADGEESGEYLISNVRDINGISEPKGSISDDRFNAETARPVYDIWSSINNDWTKKFIDRNTGEFFIIRGDRPYSLNLWYNESTGDIVDGFGDPVTDDEGNIMRDAVAREELTGRYEQLINPQESRAYHIFLGQDEKNEILKDSVGNDIIGFPIKPGGFFIYIDADRYLIKDNGTGGLMGSANILDGTGTIDYTSGEITFKLTAIPEEPLRIVYYKNSINMARYYSFSTDKFRILPQFLKYEDANRTLG